MANRHFAGSNPTPKSGTPRWERTPGKAATRSTLPPNPRLRGRMARPIETLPPNGVGPAWAATRGSPHRPPWGRI